MAAKGGARRLNVPPTDLGHLEDLLADVVKKEGDFNFRSYRSVQARAREHAADVGQ